MHEHAVRHQRLNSLPSKSGFPLFRPMYGPRESIPALFLDSILVIQDNPQFTLGPLDLACIISKRSGLIQSDLHRPCGSGECCLACIISKWNHLTQSEFRLWALCLVWLISKWSGLIQLTYTDLVASEPNPCQVTVRSQSGLSQVTVRSQSGHSFQSIFSFNLY